MAPPQRGIEALDPSTEKGNASAFCSDKFS